MNGDLEVKTPLFFPSTYHFPPPPPPPLRLGEFLGTPLLVVIALAVMDPLAPGQYKYVIVTLSSPAVSMDKFKLY